MPVPNTSATGGYLRPKATPAPLQGQALNRFFQQFVVGVTGLNGKMVRPAWQAEPPDIPDAGEAWAAIRTTTVKADNFPALIHDGGATIEDGESTLLRNELISINASFYDLGTNGEADRYASLLRDGLIIPQNLEVLTLQQMGLTETGDMVTVPSLLKERWLYRVDLMFVVSRMVSRAYAVENVTSAEGTIAVGTEPVIDIAFQVDP